jgi:hypothetical protein
VYGVRVVRDSCPPPSTFLADEDSVAQRLDLVGLGWPAAFEFALDVLDRMSAGVVVCGACLVAWLLEFLFEHPAPGV